MSNLVNHAKRELELAGYNLSEPAEDDPFDYDNAVARGVVKMVELFASEGHSGMSAWVSTSMLQKLLNFEPLTPLTDNPEEWINVHDNTWQNARQGSAFSLNGGKSYYVLDERRKNLQNVLRKLPKRAYFWVWNNWTWMFYPMHTPAKYEAQSLDTAEVSR